jgi:hypothetical protein
MVTNNYVLDPITNEPPAFVGVAVSSSLKGNDRCTATVAGAITTHGVFLNITHRKVGARIGFVVDPKRRVWEGRDSNYKPPMFVELPVFGSNLSNPPPLRYLHEDASPGVDRTKNASYRFLFDRSTSDLVGTMQLGNALQHNISIHAAHATALFARGTDGATWLANQPNKYILEDTMRADVVATPVTNLGTNADGAFPFTTKLEYRWVYPGVVNVSGTDMFDWKYENVGAARVRGSAFHRADTDDPADVQRRVPSGYSIDETHQDRGDPTVLAAAADSVAHATTAATARDFEPDTIATLNAKDAHFAKLMIAGWKESVDFVNTLDPGLFDSTNAGTLIQVGLVPGLIPENTSSNKFRTAGKALFVAHAYDRWLQTIQLRLIEWRTSVVDRHSNLGTDGSVAPANFDNEIRANTAVDVTRDNLEWTQLSVPGGGAAVPWADQVQVDNGTNPRVDGTGINANIGLTNENFNFMPIMADYDWLVRMQAAVQREPRTRSAKGVSEFMANVGTLNQMINRTPRIFVRPFVAARFVSGRGQMADAANRVWGVADTGPYLIGGFNQSTDDTGPILTEAIPPPEFPDGGAQPTGGGSKSKKKSTRFRAKPTASEALQTARENIAIDSSVTERATALKDGHKLGVNLSASLGKAIEKATDTDLVGVDTLAKLYEGYTESEMASAQTFLLTGV